MLLQCVQTLTELRKAFSSLIRAPSIRNANTCDCVTRRSPATSAGAYGEPPPSHTHSAPPYPCPCLWAFTRCHYFIVSLHACDWAVQLTLWCSGQACCSPAHRSRGVQRRAVWVWDSPFPGQASLPAHLASTHSSTPHTVYLCIPLPVNVHLDVYIVCRVVTCVLGHNCMIYCLCLTVGHLYTSSFCFLRDIIKRKRTLHKLSSEGMVVLANESLLLNFHPPLCQVLELKGIIVGIVSVFRKMNYW